MLFRSINYVLNEKLNINSSVYFYSKQSFEHNYGAFDIKPKTIIKPTLKIQKWQGRLGNNIIQLINVLSIALYYNYNIIIPPHAFFNKQFININNNNIINTHNIIIDTEGLIFIIKVELHGFRMKHLILINQKSKKCY